MPFCHVVKDPVGFSGVPGAPVMNVMLTKLSPQFQGALRRSSSRTLSMIRFDWIASLEELVFNSAWVTLVRVPIACNARLVISRRSTTVSLSECLLRRSYHHGDRQSRFHRCHKW